MLKSVRHSVARKKLSWQKRARSQTETVDILARLANVKSVIIFMPEVHEDFGLVLNRLNEFKTFFPGAKFSGVIRSNYASFVGTNTFQQLYVLGPQDIGLIGLPKREILAAISKSSYDLLIDFNNEFDIISTYLCSRIDANVRVCLAHPHREPFYNLQIRADSCETLDQKINTLFKYLAILSQQSMPTRQNLLPA